MSTPNSEQPSSAAAPAVAAPPAATPGSPIIGSAIQAIYKNLLGEEPKDEAPAAAPAKPAASPEAQVVAAEKPAQDPPASGEKPAQDPVPSGDPKPAEPKPSGSRKRAPKSFVVGGGDGDVEKIAKAAGIAAAEAMRASQPEPTPTEPAKEALPSVLQERSDEFSALERLYPDRYGNGKLSGAVEKSAAAIREFERNWTEQNPGKMFVPEDHEDDIDALMPRIPEKHRIDAAVDVVVKKQTAPIAQQLEEDKLRTSLEPAMRAASLDIQAEVAAIVDPDLGKIVGDGDAKAFQEYLKTNQEMANVAAEISHAFSEMAARGVALLKGGAKLFDARNEVDVHVVRREFPAVEAKLKGQVDPEGRVFATFSDYEKMSDRARAKAWVLTPEVFAEHIRGRAKEVATTEVQRLSRLGDVFSKKVQNKNGDRGSTPKQSAEVVVKPANTTDSTASIESPSTGPTIVSGQAPKSGPQNVREAMWRNMVG